MKCLECKYYYSNGTCSTGVFKDLDKEIIEKVNLGCKFESPKNKNDDNKHGTHLSHDNKMGMFINEYIDRLLSNSFKGWNDDKIGGYMTGLISVREKIKQFNIDE